MDGNEYARYLGSPEKIFQDMQELEEYRMVAGKLKAPIEDSLLESLQTEEVPRPFLNGKQRYDNIGRLYTELMRAEGMKCLDIARYLHRHMFGMTLGTAKNYITALRKGYIYQSQKRTGERVEDITKYLRRAVHALRACNVPENHQILTEFQKANSQFFHYWCIHQTQEPRTNWRR